MNAADLKKLSRKELEKLVGDAQAQIKRLDEKDIDAARKAVEKVAREHGFSFAELTGGAAAAPARKKPGPKSKARPKAKAKPGPKPKGRKPAAAKSKGVARYRNPDNPSQTWTGKGRKPNWYLQGMAAGRPESDYLI